MQEPHAAQRPQRLPLQAPTSTHRAPGTRCLYTYCIALLIGDRVELSAIVERGVNPTPLVCRLPEWPETAGRMQGEQQQSREQRREEEKIKAENKKSRKQYSKNSCRPGGKELSSVPALGRGAFLIILGTYLLPTSWDTGQPASSRHGTLLQLQWGRHNLSSCRDRFLELLRCRGNLSSLPQRHPGSREAERRGKCLT